MYYFKQISSDNLLQCQQVTDTNFDTWKRETIVTIPENVEKGFGIWQWVEAGRKLR